MKHILESLDGRVRKMRNSPSMANTYMGFAINEIADCLKDLDSRLSAIEARQPPQEKQRIDWQVGAMVPTPAKAAEAGDA